MLALSVGEEDPADVAGPQAKPATIATIATIKTAIEFRRLHHFALVFRRMALRPGVKVVSPPPNIVAGPPKPTTVANASRLFEEPTRMTG